MKQRLRFATVAGIALLAPVANAHAAAYSFSTAPVSIDRQLSIGFVFTPTKDVTVTSLGYYDDLGDGFKTEHQVGIYFGDGMAGAGPLLALTTLAAGTSGVLGANDFRYQSIAPLLLKAGQTYTIAGTSPNPNDTNDPWVYGGPNEYTGFAVDPRISIGLNAARFTYDAGPNLVDPAQHCCDYQFYAVNFDFTSTVPEPDSLAIMTLGLAVLGAAISAVRRSALQA